VSMDKYADVAMRDLIRENANLLAQRDALLEACKTFEEWLRREDAGYSGQRDTPEHNREFSEWFLENIRLCDLSIDQARAAIAMTEGER